MHERELKTIGQLAHYKITQVVLGAGGTANVHLAYDTRNNRYLAVKIIPDTKKRQVLQELKALKKLQGLQGVIQVEHIAQHENHFFMFMEIAEMELYEYLMQLGGRLDEDSARPIFFQMATSLFECHSKRVFHHDVKLENFVLVASPEDPEKKEIKLIDFGFAAELGTSQRTSQGDDTYIDNYFAGSPAYSPPQVLAKKAHSAAKTDIFALGVCLYVMLCGQFPFCDVTKDSLEHLRRNISKPLSFPADNTLSQNAKQLLLGMLAFHEHHRLTLEQILEHDFFRISQ
jgi:5'-AMP-activated protein kinase catalytic alpha subunit